MNETYTTQSGDVWDAIAYKALGSCRHTERLIDCNRQHIKTTVFSAGVVLTLPGIEQGEGVRNLPPWRKKR